MLAYRKDIDGMRAIAVLAIIAFHFGIMPNGYIGVDIFFVISGYLITGIIYNDITKNQFTIAGFYLRRLRRITPLYLATGLIALVIGIFVMLPDDLENLSESVIATNLFANNVLQLITTGNYWDVVNEFKPLLHTWSLGIEEQYYMFYPFLFLLIGKKKPMFITWVLVILTLLSVVFFFSHFVSAPVRFYLLPFRFFELSIGGIGTMYLNKFKYNPRLCLVFIGALVALFVLPIYSKPTNIMMLATVLVSLGLVVTCGYNNTIKSILLESKVIVWLGKISFSLYVWRQIVIAYTLYFIAPEFTPAIMIADFFVVVLLASVTYYFIEQPFRNKTKVSTRFLLWSLSITFIISTGLAAIIYARAGVIRNVPELDITTSTFKRQMHSNYNAAINQYSKPFAENGKIKVLIIGNSQARDWANVLLESKYKDSIDVAYFTNLSATPAIQSIISKAELIFFADAGTRNFIEKLYNTYHIDTNRVWCVGVKNFGISNGYFYSQRYSAGYLQQTGKLEEKHLTRNHMLRQMWGQHYIDLISEYANGGRFNVFTPDGKFKSQDCRHLTRAGAIYFSHLVEPKLDSVFAATKIHTHN